MSHDFVFQIYEVVQAVAREVPYCASTKDLPPMINGFPTESRERVVHELYTTEYRYVRQLEVVVEVSHMYDITIM